MKEIKKVCLEYKLYIILLIYILFVFSSLKKVGMPLVDGIETNNVIVITLLSFFIILFKRNFHINKLKAQVYGTLLSICSIYGIIVVENTPQFIYAGAQLFVPMLLLLVCGKQNKQSFYATIKVFNLVSTIYALIAIYVSVNYPEIYQNASNTVGGLSRIAMPIGSTITLSYYMNISLPFALILFYEENKKIYKSFYLISVIINILITFMQLSRSASFTAVIIVLVFIFFVQSDKRGKGKFSLFMAILFAVCYIFNKFDLSRLTLSVIGNASGFDDARYSAVELGLHLFSKHPILGTGLGSYFHRAWTGNNVLHVDGVSGLIDPHNSFVLILSETGIIGFLLFLFFLFICFKKLMIIQDSAIRRGSYLFVIAIFINAMSGSQLVNEINYACITYIYLSVFLGQVNMRHEENEK